MNEYITGLNYLKGLFESNSNVKTIIHGVTENIDLDKSNEYPLVNIFCTSFNPRLGDEEAVGTVAFRYTISILTNRIESNTPFTDKWLKSDNEIANYNTTIGIALQFFSDADLINDENIDIIEINEPEIGTLMLTNLLDGCIFDCVITVPNQTGC